MVKVNWLRTSCVVSITTAATWHIWTADFWADFEQRIIDRTINEWQNDCGVVSIPKDSIRTRVVTFETVKHFIFPTETLFSRFNFSVHKAPETVEWRAVKDCHGNSLQLVLCCKHNCFLTLWFNPLMPTLKLHNNGLLCNNGDWHTGHWWVGCYIRYSEEGPWQVGALPSPLLAVQNVTAHPSTASLPATYYLMWHYNCLWDLKG